MSGRRVEVYFVPTATDERTFAGRTAVMVDLLRASTTIVTALYHGAREVIPAESAERAVSLRNEIGNKNVLLCGERGGERIPGFNLGNSPREYTAETVGGHTLLFASSNGSKAILAAREAEALAIGALVNVDAVVKWVGETERDCVIVCAGKLGAFSGEDAACAGYMVSKLQAFGFEPANDAAKVAISCGKEAATDWLAYLKSTDHGRYLVELGYGSDFPLVAGVNRLPIVPVMRENKIVPLSKPVEA